jgi:hypothetical protein
VIEQEEEEVDYRRLSAKELAVLVAKGDDNAIDEKSRRDKRKVPDKDGPHGISTL